MSSRESWLTELKSLLQMRRDDDLVKGSVKKGDEP